MERATSPGRLLIEAASLARIEELAEAGGNEDRRSEMMSNAETENPTTTDADRELKAATRAAWALGDYHRFAKETVWGLGEVLVRACGISTGQRVLDVAAGTGNTAIRAAEAGAKAVVSDLTPENFQAGRREAEAHGVELEWVEADAEALPFADGEFDVVTSSFGAIFAPDHRAVANEMLRVCRPGGSIGMLNFTPEGLISDFFGALAPYMPPPPAEALPPPLWGSEEHVKELFGDRVDFPTLERDVLEITAFERPRDYGEHFRKGTAPPSSPRPTHETTGKRRSSTKRWTASATSGTAARPTKPVSSREYLLAVGTRK